MEKYTILLGYFDKQRIFIKKLYDEIVLVDISIYAERFVFALRVQQIYTVLEDLFKQIAKSFENHIENLKDKELLDRMNTDIPKIRPEVISQQSLIILDKIRTFRDLIYYAYDCELDEYELNQIQKKLKTEFSSVETDLQKFRSYIETLAQD